MNKGDESGKRKVKMGKIDRIREGLEKGESSWAKRAKLLIEARKELDKKETIERPRSGCVLPVLEADVPEGGWLLCHKLRT